MFPCGFFWGSEQSVYPGGFKGFPEVRYVGYSQAALVRGQLCLCDPNYCLLGPPSLPDELVNFALER